MGDAVTIGGRPRLQALLTKVQGVLGFKHGGTGLSATPSSGQLLIGSNSGFSLNTLTAGPGISIGNGSGIITITGTGGAGGTGLYSQVLSATPTQSNTGLSNWGNQGSATEIDATTGMTIKQPSSDTGYAVLYKTKAANPVSYTALIAQSSIPGNGSQNPACVLGFYDGTKIQGIGTITTGSAFYVVVTNWTNLTTFSTNPALLAYAGAGNGLVWVKIVDDATNLVYYYSMDGANWVKAYTNTVANFLSAATNVFFGCSSPPSDSNYGTLMSWAQGTS
jgi:hypothetical protein